MCERQVQVLKRSMQSVLGSRQDLTYPEIETLFASAANLANNRPLAVRTFKEDEIRSITPNDLLLGRTRNHIHGDSGFGDDDNMPCRLEVIKELEDLWWKMWVKQVFPSLVPFRK